MFIGHYALGFAAKSFAKKSSLGVLFLASQLIDLIWPVLILIGIEKVAVVEGITKLVPFDFVFYPWSHSLAMVIVWGFVFGLIYYGIKRQTKIALIAGMLVISHWFLDFIVHRPDLPLYPGSLLVGLGVWNQVLLSIVIESGLFIFGLVIYLRATSAKNKKGIFGLVLLVLLLSVSYILNLISPPPPDDHIIIGISGLAQWLFIGLAFWVDRHRQIIQGGV